MNAFLKNIYKSEWWFLAITTLLVLYVRIRHIDIAFERDEGEYTYAAQEILKGKIPYVDFYNMKLPGVYYFFALIFSVFPDNLFTVKVTLLFVNLFNALLVYFIAKRISSDNDTKIFAPTAAALYLLMSVGYGAQGWTANAEHFMLLPALIGIYILLEAHRFHSLFRYFLSGCFLSWAFISKQHAIGYILIAPIWLSTLFFKNNSENKNLKSFFKLFFIPMLWYTIGGLFVFGALLFYFHQVHAFKELVFYTVDYASTYGSKNVPFEGIWRFRAIFFDSPIFYVMMLVAIFHWFKNSEILKGQYFLMIFALGSFLCIHLGWFYRPHYFQLLLPGAAILSAFIINHLSDIWKKYIAYINPHNIKWTGLILTIILQFPYFFTSTSAQVDDKMYGNEKFPDLKEIAALLPKYMTDKGKIGIIGSEPEIFFYTKKESANSILYHFPMYEDHKYADQMFTTFKAEMERNKPEILMYFCDLERFDGCNTTIDVNMQKWYHAFTLDYKLLATYYIDREENIGKLCWESQKSILSPNFTSKFYIWKRK
jgi:hypothetical protein